MMKRNIATSLLVSFALLQCFAENTAIPESRNEIAAISQSNAPAMRNNNTSTQPAQPAAPVKTQTAPPSTPTAATPVVKPGDPLPSSVPDATMQYAGVLLKGSNPTFFATGAFLYWTNRGFDGAQAIKTTGATIATPPFNKTIYKLDKPYRPGFKVGIGMILPQFDQWVSFLEYTRFHHEATGHAAIHNFATEYLSPATLNPLGLQVPYSSIKTKASTHFDELKLSLQRPFYLGKRVTISPFMGLKGVWIDYKFRQDLVVSPAAPTSPIPIYSPGSQQTQQAHPQDWMVGPYGGANGNLLLGAGLSVLCKAEISLLYARYKNSESITGVPNPGFAPPFIVNWNNSFENKANAVVAMGHGGLGLGWGTYFSKQQFHFDFAASYDFTASWTPSPVGSAVVNGALDFVFHGLVVNGRLDF